MNLDHLGQLGHKVNKERKEGQDRKARLGRLEFKGCAVTLAAPDCRDWSEDQVIAAILVYLDQPGKRETVALMGLLDLKEYRAGPDLKENAVFPESVICLIVLEAIFVYLAVALLKYFVTNVSRCN